MILDSQTNFLYIADTLPVKYPEFYETFISKLGESGIEYALLPGTKDIWAMDYMPIQISENKFIQFKYKPDYLTWYKKDEATISDVDAICEQIGIKPIKSDIIVDGGNISRWENKALMTSKVFKENKHIPLNDLITEVKELLEIEQLYFVPAEKGDWSGHVDGMARFIDHNTVLINDYNEQDKADNLDFFTALHNANLKWIPFTYYPDENEVYDDATGLYLNYLEMDKFIILPVFGLRTDETAIEKAKEIWPNKQIIPVISNEPAKQNGVINCMTWNVYNPAFVQDINDLVPLYGDTKSMLIVHKLDYHEQHRSDDIPCVKVHVKDSTIDQPWSIQKMLKFGYYEPIDNDQLRKACLDAIKKSFKPIQIDEIINNLLIPKKAALESLTEVPSRLKL